jgi:hypothetical protein
MRLAVFVRRALPERVVPLPVRVVALVERPVPLPVCAVALPVRVVALVERAVALVERAVALVERAVALVERAVPLPERAVSAARAAPPERAFWAAAARDVVLGFLLIAFSADSRDAISLRAWARRLSMELMISWLSSMRRW